MLERIAQVVRENPSATARDIARRLGYSEEKSIYYWLDKGQFKGLKDFRQAVLTGRFQQGPYIVGQGQTQQERGEIASDTLNNVPVATSFAPGGRPVFSGSTVSAMFRTSREAFGFLLGIQEYAPTLLKGDILIVDPALSPSRGDLVLVFWEGTPKVVRFYPADEKAVLIHPSELTAAATVTWDAFRLMGKIAGIIRRFPSSI